MPLVIHGKDNDVGNLKVKLSRRRERERESKHFPRNDCLKLRDATSRILGRNGRNEKYKE